MISVEPGEQVARQVNRSSTGSEAAGGGDSRRVEFGDASRARKFRRQPPVALLALAMRSGAGYRHDIELKPCLTVLHAEAIAFQPARASTTRQSEQAVPLTSRQKRYSKG